MSNATQSTWDKDLSDARQIVLAGVGARARVYLYGSRARGNATRTSDIDIGIVPTAPLDPAALSDIREALEQSNILSTVDLVDLSRADETFRAHVLADAVEWTA